MTVIARREPCPLACVDTLDRIVGEVESIAMSHLARRTEVRVIHEGLRRLVAA